MSQRHFILALLMTMLVACPLWAQHGLPIDGIFHGAFKNVSHATEIVVTGDKAASLGLTIYRSLTIDAASQAASQVCRIVTKQGAQAQSREVEYRQGKLYYGFYMLAPYQNGNNKLNRYVFFLNQSLSSSGSKGQIIVIYMESAADSDYIKRLIKQS